MSDKNRDPSQRPGQDQDQRQKPDQANPNWDKDQGTDKASPQKEMPASDED